MSKAISVSCSCHHSEILRLSRCRTGVDGVPELVCGSNWICPKLPRSPIVHRTMCHQNPTHWLKRFTLFFDKANYHLTIILYPPDIPIVFRVPILSIHQWPSWRSPPTPGTSAEPRFFFSVDKFLLEYWNHHSFHQPPKKNVRSKLWKWRHVPFNHQWPNFYSEKNDDFLWSPRLKRIHPQRLWLDPKKDASIAEEEDSEDLSHEACGNMNQHGHPKTWG